MEKSILSSTAAMVDIITLLIIIATTTGAPALHRGKGKDGCCGCYGMIMDNGRVLCVVLLFG